MKQQNPQPAAPPAPAKKDDKPKRYAAYDKAFLRFVGGVHDSQADARKAAKDKGVATSDVEIREV